MFDNWKKDTKRFHVGLHENKPVMRNNRVYVTNILQPFSGLSE